MKRHVLSTKESVMEVKKEKNNEEDNVTKKRLKTSHEEKSISSNKVPENMEDDFDLNGHSVSMNMHFSGAETSTPISAHNGEAVEKTKKKNEKTKEPVAFSICTDTPPPPNISNESNGIPSPINGMCTYEDETVEMNCHNDEDSEIVVDVNGHHDDEETVPFPSPVAQRGKSQVKDVEETVEKNREGIQKRTKDSSFKYDIDSFLNSLLEVEQLEGHADKILAVIADGDIILSASADTTIKLWNAAKKTEVLNFQGHTAAVTALVLLTSEQSDAIASKMKFTDVTRILISASLDCSVRMWAVNSGVELSSFYTYNGISCLEYLEDFKQVIIGTDGGKLELWDLISSKVVHSVLAHEEGITSLKVEDSYVYTTSTDGKAKVWVLEDDECYAIYTRRRMQRSIQSSELRPAQWQCVASHDNMMYLGDNTSNIKILDWRKGNIKVLKNQLQQNGSIDNILIKEDILLSLFYDGDSETSGINVWKLPSMTYECTMLGAVDKLSCLTMTVTEDKILRVVSGGKKLLVWNFIMAKPPSKETDAKYYCREVGNLGAEVKEIDEPDKPLSPAKRNTVEKETKSKPASWSCTVM